KKIIQIRRENAEGTATGAAAERSEQAGLIRIEGDLILVAAGRRGNTDGLGLEKAGVRVERSYIPTDRNLRTSVKYIYACGDVNGKFLFTHAAGAEGSVVIRRAVLRLPATMSYDYIPWSTYSDPELASVGYNEKRAAEAGIDYRTLTAEFDENDRAWAEKSEGGRMKILLDRKDRVIGVQIAAAHAGELIGPAIFAVRKGWKISEFLSPVFPYPTLSEIYRKAAGNYLSPRLFNPKVRDILKILFHYRGTA
ncbi:MAG: FAD-dependent oxidoreductase, partial [Spirochaetota bacterium]|nr:FAD-dependent oxidoreductase [Spirochaetota bacterium]